ncbi:MAG: UDP-N-acetylmuramate dehydrogenase [Bacteroidales bacterium]|nr:UDP-N-acetylmuramate dehydrogenase [Bacteroidales bacterium]
MFEIKENFSLKNYNSFGVDVKTRYYTECSSVEELSDFIRLQKEKNLPLFILGGGSNVLFTGDFEGYVVRPAIKGIEVISENENDIQLKVGAGEDWDDFVEYCVKQNWGGIENLSLIPGNAGTCPIQNIGAYGVEVKDVIVDVETLCISTLKTYRFKNEECKFGYRDSIFKRKLKGTQIITHVTFNLKKQPVFKLNYGNLTEELNRHDKVNLQSIRKAVIDIRNSKLPKPEEIGNAGSFFKNPVIEKSKANDLMILFADMPSYDQGEGKIKIPAGWLIEKAGWKGKRIGNVGVHEKQSLVLVNYGNATGSEILHLARNIQQSIIVLFDIELDIEVNIV